MIKILTEGAYNVMTRVAVIKNVIEAERIEEINGENTLDFTAVLDSKIQNLIHLGTVFELDDDYFDLLSFEKTLNDDGTYTIKVTSEHISYRLNKPQYDVNPHTDEEGRVLAYGLWSQGSPGSILGGILYGPGFTVGTVDLSTEQRNIYVNEKKSRRQLLMEFAAFVGGELLFNKFTVSLLAHRGSTSITSIINDRDVKTLTYSIARNLDSTSTVTYTCAPVHLSSDNYALGDNIRVRQHELGINQILRVVRITRNPYDDMSTVFEFGDYKNDLANALRPPADDNLAKNPSNTPYLLTAAFGDGTTGGRIRFSGGEITFQTIDSDDNVKDCLFYKSVDENGALDPPVLVFDGELAPDVYVDIDEHNDERYEPIGGGGGGGSGGISSAGNIFIEEITESGNFETDTWEHGYADTFEETTVFVATPEFSEDYIVDWWAIELLSDTVMRVVGHITLT